MSDHQCGWQCRQGRCNKARIPLIFDFAESPIASLVIAILLVIACFVLVVAVPQGPGI